MNLIPRSLSRTLLLTGMFAGLVLAATPLRAQDPPASNGRLYHLDGVISVQPSGSDDWGRGFNNMPIDPGDRVTSDSEARADLEVGPVRSYFGPNSDLTLVNLSAQGIELGQARGTVHYYSDGFFPGQTLFISTPNGALTITKPADFRVDIFPDQNTTVITNGEHGEPVTVSGAGGFSAVLQYDQAIQLSGTNPVYAQPIQRIDGDDFAHWSGGVESHRHSSLSARYVSTEMVGYDELDQAGDWQPESDYGPIWFPHVQAGWAPYHYGHWVHRPFFGWTWVADEPWGAAPFHYGRWVNMGGRWGWIPGPREGHPVWSPAQVVFAGGIQVGGVGVSAWFPLGPGEAYKPWYPCSPAYINQINISNIHESRVVHVQNTYVNIVNVTNVTYVNHTTVTAMNTSDFAAGRPAHQSAVVVNTAQIQHIQPAAPQAAPPAHPVIEHPSPKPANVATARPVLINHEGKAAAAAPNAKPVAVPVKPTPPPAKAVVPAKAAPAAPAKTAPTATEKATPAATPAKTAAPAEKAAPAATPAKSAAPAKPAAPAEKAAPAAAETKPAPATTTPAKDAKKKDEKKTPPPPPPAEKPSNQ